MCEPGDSFGDEDPEAFPYTGPDEDSEAPTWGDKYQAPLGLSDD